MSAPQPIKSHERETVDTPDIVNFAELGESELAKARAANSGRATVRVGEGPGMLFRQVLLALAAGHALADHPNPGEASLHVLRGRLRLEWSGGSVEASTGDFLTIPPERHGVVAIEDSVAVLTVAHAQA
jgi:quercetin dioxygenase-like cupin family protein